MAAYLLITSIAEVRQESGIFAFQPFMSQGFPSLCLAHASVLHYTLIFKTSDSCHKNIYIHLIFSQNMAINIDNVTN